MSSPEAKTAPSVPPPDPVAIGEIIDNRLRVERIIGNGAIGIVVEATHLELNERVALKFLRPAEKTRKDQITRFAREARAAARLKGEHVARVFDVGVLPTGDPFMVMELLQGLDLEQYVEQNGPILNVATAALYMIQACEALAEAHSLDIVHRDIKPANLFLYERPGALPMIKLLDFGISKAALTGEYTDVALAETKTTTIMGTPYYMAPEQVRSTKDVDRRADIWALGAVMYELLTGRTIWRSEELGALVQEILREEPIPILEVRPDLGAAFAAALGGALQTDAERRYPNAADFATALLPFAPATAQVHVERALRFAKSTPASVPTLRTSSRKNISTDSSIDVQASLAADVRPPGSRILVAAVGLSVVLVFMTAGLILVPRLLAKPVSVPVPAPFPAGPAVAAPVTVHVDPPSVPIEDSPVPSASAALRVTEPHGRRPPVPVASPSPRAGPSAARTNETPIPPPATVPAPATAKKHDMDDNPWQKSARPKLEDDPFAKP